MIAATNRDLAKGLEAGTFRADLYYRLNVFPIRLPALRHRHADIPLLVWHFVTKHQAKLGKTFTAIPKRGWQALQTYRWPGNVRVLEACAWQLGGPGQAAERLGLNPSTLRSRMRKLGLLPPQGHGK